MMIWHHCRQRYKEHFDRRLVCILNKMADVAQKQGHYLEASNCLQRLSEIHATIDLPDDPEATKALASLAIVLDLQGRYAEAESLYLQAAEKRKDKTGPNDSETLKLLENLALNYRMQREYSMATATYVKVLSQREKGKDPAKRRTQVMQTAANSQTCIVLLGKRTRRRVYFVNGAKKSTSEIGFKWMTGSRNTFPDICCFLVRLGMVFR